MIRHIAVFSWTPEATAESKRLVAEQLATLPGQMRGLVSYSFGHDAGLVEGNGDFAVVADFEDVAAYFAYREHPVHQEVIRNVISPITRQRLTIQVAI